ncbi:hypothetical protein RB195_016270 [Necator americanus]|uniref:Uncharacterized protein n=1 Tax=Necator americanus TaxID=51031 RepID=A0ABR1E8C5_NECAM
MIMNQQIRRGVCLLLTRRKADTKNSSVGSWVKTHKKANTHGLSYLRNMVVFEHLSTTNLRMDEFHVGLCLETTAQAEYENLHSRLVVGALWTVVSWMIHPWLVDEMEITITPNNHKR